MPSPGAMAAWHAYIMAARVLYAILMHGKDSALLLIPPYQPARPCVSAYASSQHPRCTAVTPSSVP